MAMSFGLAPLSWSCSIHAGIIRIAWSYQPSSSSVRSRNFIRMKFLERTDEEEGWYDQAIRMIPAWMEQLQDKGARPKDIAILVRKNEEGQQIASYLLNFRNTNEAKPGYSYEVVSN